MRRAGYGNSPRSGCRPRGSFETTKADETIHSVLAGDGALALQWRLKAAEAQVDRGLTSESSATLAVQEDGLRLVWDLALAFSRSQRERFHINLPTGYLLEKVAGDNVRGWEVHKGDKGQTVEVSLLKPAKDRERFALRLWHAGAVGQEGLAEFDVPLVEASGAAQAAGQISICRSPLLDVRTVAQTGLERIDFDPSRAATGAGAEDESPLGLRPYQSFRFATMPFTLRLAAAPLVAQATAEVQTLLKFGELDRTFESRVILHIEGRPLYRIEMFLPEDLHFDRVAAPGRVSMGAGPPRRPAAVGDRLDFEPAGRGACAAARHVGPPGTGRRASPSRRGRSRARSSCRSSKCAASSGRRAISPCKPIRPSMLKPTVCAAVRRSELEQVYAWLERRSGKRRGWRLHYRQPGYRGTLQLSPASPT